MLSYADKIAFYSNEATYIDLINTYDDLRELQAERISIKNEMRLLNTEDPEWEILNNEQFAIKLHVNTCIYHDISKQSDIIIKDHYFDWKTALAH